MLLGLTVTWGGRRMMSTFEIEVPLPPTKLSIVWSIPPLVRLEQATLSFAAVNVTDDPIDAIVEIEGSPMIPLLKQIKVPGILPNEERRMTVQVVPTVAGVNKLNYVVKIGQSEFKPLFKTVVCIAS
jgi:hypothetical protein